MKTHSFLIIAFVAILFALGFFLPGNPITGSTIKEECKDCVQRCSADSECSDGKVCCATQWESNVCAYETRCAKISEYSDYMSIEQYEENVQSQPPIIDASFRWFFLPLIIITAIILYFSVRRNPEQKE